MRPAERDLARCRSCAAPIVWALTAEGRQMPVDAEPSEIGNLTLDRRHDGLLLVAVTTPSGASPLRYRPHLKTCPTPNADERRHR